MSHHLYLQCASHEPPITDGKEVSNFLSELELVIHDVETRGLSAEMYSRVHERNDFDWHATVAEMGRIRAVIGAFTNQHPNCAFAVIDEYDKIQWTEKNNG